MLKRIVNGPVWQALRTYQWEYAAAVVYLAAVTLATTNWQDPRQVAGQVISACAVFASFAHMSVGSRLEEAQDRSDVKTVDCYYKLTRWLVTKEVLWLTAFTLLGAWAALAGIPLFLLYPAWRRFYRGLRG